MSAGPRIAAFFDLDGTLVPAPSLERRFARFLLRRALLGPAQGARWLVNLLRHIRSNPCAAIEGNKAYLATVPTTAVDHWAAELESPSLALFGSGMHELEWHAAQGHRIFVVSGTLAPLARVAARRFSVPVEICATELETMSARWTGRIQGEHISGPAKARAVARLAARYDLDLKLSFAYGDQPSDVAMLETVGRPRAINPSPRLERIARRRAWPVLEWLATQGACEPGPTKPSSRALLRVQR
jgi:HAD superfamily hydrolase (TIGR01490 family)